SYVSAVYVHPYHVRHGIGSSLLQAIERLAWERGVGTIRVAASLTAQRFYQRNGYQVRTFSSLQSQDSIRIPIVNMQKCLTPN
ncbi:MAG: GNAT family N-acetyltransferase, partial [Cyanobacteria bacterium P01_H01_bin.121]